MNNVENILRGVATKLRYLRQAQNLTIATLSERSGVAKSTLTGLEAGLSNPTLSTLVSLADALSVKIDDLILGTGDDEGMVIVRSGDGINTSDESMEGRLVRSAIVGPSMIEFHQVKLSDGKRGVSTSHGLGSREHVLVVEGKVVAGPLTADEHVLQAGDYATYSTATAHNWIPVGGDAIVWIVATYPRTSES